LGGKWVTVRGKDFLQKISSHTFSKGFRFFFFK